MGQSSTSLAVGGLAVAGLPQASAEKKPWLSVVELLINTYIPKFRTAVMLTLHFAPVERNIGFN